MSHPENKKDRRRIGLKKAKKRINQAMSPEERRKHPQRANALLKIYKNVTRACSCWMCGNPRKTAKGKDAKTIQERKIDEAENSVE